jgi:tRNA (cytosine38-C5)-methyltransferase
LFGHDDNTVAIEHDQSQESCDKLLQSCEPVEKFLEFENHSDQMDTESGLLDATIVPIDAYGALEKNDDAYGRNDISLNQYLVPLSLIERWGSAMGILNLFSLSLLTSPIYYFIIYIDHLSLSFSLKISLKDFRYCLS